eukprot:s106_g11.t1
MLNPRPESGDQFGTSDRFIELRETPNGDTSKDAIDLRETPNGDTSKDAMLHGELPHGKTQHEFTCRKSLTGFSLEDLYVIEICAGSARLSKVAHGHGFRTMAVDHSTSRTCGFPICIFDLTDANDLQTLLNFLDEAADCILAVWIAPPCGTSSRAREKKLPELEALGMKVPGPLRSLEQPDQLDGLSGVDKIKVEKANMLYDAVYTLATKACELRIFTAIENPSNSHYWGTTPTRRLCEEQQHHFVDFHTCAHGGDRDKATSLWVNDDWLDELSLFCDGKHKHKPWTTQIRGGGLKFSTKEEAAYPFLLCERIINCLKGIALQLGAHSPENMQQQALGPTRDRLSRLVLGALPRGHKVRPLVSEYGHYNTVYVDPQQPSLLDKYLAEQPKGSKITSRRMVTWGEFQAASMDDQHTTTLLTDHIDMVEKVHTGIPSSPDEFIQRAINAGHPRSLDQFMDPQIEVMLRANFSGEPVDLAKRRISFFNKYLKRAQELAESEKALRMQMPEHVRMLVGDKRLLLWREILQDLDYPDVALVDEIAAGFKLSGWMNKSNVFKPRTKRPSMSMETLKRLSKTLNASTLRAMEVRQEQDLEAATWEETVEEEKKGWIWFDDNTDHDGCKFIGRRFGIQQSAKTRVIDDCSCCGLNWTVGLHEKFGLQSIDILASMLAAAFKFSDGDAFPEVLGRCYDLKSAYKQFAVHSEDRSVLRMAVRDPSCERPKLIGFNALPFGAVGSVAGFLRISMAVWYIGLVALQICWTAFYDDFSVLSRKELLSNTSWCVETLFTMLGLKYAKDGKKYLPFDDKFKMLGLRVDLSASSKRLVYIGHTDERKEELRVRIDEILAAGVMDSKEAERLRGRMVFFEGYTFGRVANAAIKNLSRFCTEHAGRRKLDDSIKYSLLAIRDRVLGAPPVSVGVHLNHTWVIFTDGACNPDQREGSIGGLIIDPNGTCQSFFSSLVPEDVMEEFFKVSANPIHELEVLPVFVACLVWGRRFTGALVVYYIDNESARMAYIRGSGETLFSSCIIHDFVGVESQLQHRTWFGRCPSASNPSDGASRLDLSWFEGRNVEHTRLSWEELRHHLRLNGERPDR